MKRLIPALFAGAALMLAAACGSDGTSNNTNSTQDQGTEADSRSDWPSVFRLGLFGGDDAEEVVQNAEPIKLLFEEALGIPVEIFTGTNYTAVVEAMRAGHIEAMTVGPFSYLLAVQEARAEAIAVSISAPPDDRVYDPDILPYYVSVIFTLKGNGVQSLEDVRERGFNFVDPASTSGHLAPKTRLIDLGYDPDADFQTVFAGTHPTSVLSVWNGTAPAGATHEGNLARLSNEGQIEWCAWSDGRYNVPRTQEEIDAHFESCPDGTIVVLHQTDPIPNTPLAVRQDLPADLKAALKEALLSTSQNAQFITDRGAWYVDPSEELGLETLDQFYNPLRDIARLLNLDLRELAQEG